MPTKICTKCKEEKELSMFYKDKRTTDGLYSACVGCHTSNNYRKEIRTEPSPKNVAFSMHHSIITRLTDGKSVYKTVKCFISKQELEGWLAKNWHSYMELHKKWAENNFKRIDMPTLDRIERLGDYTLDNIQILSLRDNLAKCVFPVRKGIPKKPKNHENK